jgi:hypothetical protein
MLFLKRWNKTFCTYRLFPCSSVLSFFVVCCPPAIKQYKGDSDIQWKILSGKVFILENHIATQVAGMIIYYKDTNLTKQFSRQINDKTVRYR